MSNEERDQYEIVEFEFRPNKGLMAYHVLGMDETFFVKPNLSLSDAIDELYDLCLDQDLDDTVTVGSLTHILASLIHLENIMQERLARLSERIG